MTSYKATFSSSFGIDDEGRPESTFNRLDGGKTSAKVCAFPAVVRRFYILSIALMKSNFPLEKEPTEIQYTVICVVSISFLL